MSYQPLPPGAPPPPPPGPVPTFHVPPPPAPPAPQPPARGSRRRGLVGLGVVLLLGGLVAGGALFALSKRAVGDTVKKFARAPVGCTTTLQFEKKAVFTIFVETKGTAIDVGGDCAGNGASYDRADSAPPTVVLTLVDAQSTTVTMTDSTAYSYDTSDYRGAAVQQVTIDTPGTYRLTVESKDNNFAIAIGGDPNVDSRQLKYIGAGSVGAGLLLGLLFLLLGLRRRPPTPAAVAPTTQTTTWSPSAGTPSNAPAGYQVPPPPGHQVPPPPPGYQPPPPMDDIWGAPPR